MIVRPKVTFLNTSLIENIRSEARDILNTIGVNIYHKETVSMLSDHGAQIQAVPGSDAHNVCIPGNIIDKALETIPAGFKLFNTKGEQTHDFSGNNIHFTPASSSLNILDYQSGQARKPNTADYIQFVKVAHQMKHIASQSTAFIPADVSEKISDTYRLYLNLLYGEKAVVTGTFSAQSFQAMKAMQIAIRGDESSLKEKPMTIFSCCSTTPLKWSGRICQDIIDCGSSHIPIELIAMPLAGFTGPVTIVGSLVGHTAENLSGIVISQLFNPGTPVLYGGAPAAFDIRYETTPLGAIETQMMDCGYNEIGKHIGVPTQAYIGLSDAKSLDAQAGLETATGATLAALSGINSISGPGMLDFVNTFSTEKLVLDNEICGMTNRMIQGIQPRDDFPTVPRYQELLKEKHLLISKHSRRNLRKEHYFPGSVIDRSSLDRWQEDGSLTLHQRAHNEVLKLLQDYEPIDLTAEVKNQLTKIMNAEAKRCGMETLPNHETDH
jgi:trimethylamine:corrinoid methyltransferase-like protein